jgi:hypothetical protein
MNSLDLTRALLMGHRVRLTRSGGWGWACSCGAGWSGHGTRLKSDVQAAARQHVEEVTR